MIEKTKKASVIAIQKNNKILCVSRGRGSDLFGLPGGFAEENETPLDTAIREAYEETGVVVHKTLFLFCKDYKSVIHNCVIDISAFMATSYDDSNLQSSDEGNVAWLSFDDASIPPPQGKSFLPSINKEIVDFLASMRYYDGNG